MGTGAAHSSVCIDFTVNNSQQESRMLLAEMVMRDMSGKLMAGAEKLLHGDGLCSTDGA